MRHAETRLERIVVRVREAARLAAEERLHARIARRDQIVALALEAVTGQDDAVVAEPPTIRPVEGLITAATLGS